MIRYTRPTGVSARSNRGHDVRVGSRPSLTAGKLGIARLVTHQAGSGVASQGRRAAGGKPRRVRVDPHASPTSCRVTPHAVALDVTPHTRRQVASRLGGVMPPRHGGGHEDLGGRMHPPSVRAIPRGSCEGYPRAHVTRLAERFVMMARAAVLRVLLRSQAVHGQEVVRMDLPRPHPTVVATGAGVLAVTPGAEPRVVGCRRSVRVHEVRTVLRRSQPSRRQQLPVGELGPQSPRRLGQVTGGTTRLRVPPRTVRQVVAGHAGAHARQPETCGFASPLYRPVALSAPDVARCVDLVIEPKTWCWHDHTPHPVPIFWLVPFVAQRTISRT